MDRARTPRARLDAGLAGRALGCAGCDAAGLAGRRGCAGAAVAAPGRPGALGRLSLDGARRRRNPAARVGRGRRGAADPGLEAAHRGWTAAPGRARRGAGATRPGRDSEFYALESRLARSVPRDQAEPLLAWLQRAAVGLAPDERAALLRLARLHYRHRFDPAGLDPAARSELSAGVAQLPRLARRRAPAARIPVRIRALRPSPSGDHHVRWRAHRPVKQESRPADRRAGGGAGVLGDPGQGRADRGPGLQHRSGQPVVFLPS